MKTKRNVFVLLAILLIAALAVVVFVACDNGGKPQPEPESTPKPEPDTPHTHTFSEQWFYDQDNHWRIATCGDTDEVKDKGEHIFGDNGECSVCGCLPFKSEGVIYKLNYDGQSYYVSDGSNAVSPNVIILSEYNGKPVTSVGVRAFDCCSKLMSITISSSVTSIGESAFSGCGSLQSVIFKGDSQLQSIGKFAFANGSITVISLPSSVTNIDSYAFSGCSRLQSVIFEDESKLQSIGDNAFV